MTWRQVILSLGLAVVAHAVLALLPVVPSGPSERVRDRQDSPPLRAVLARVALPVHPRDVVHPSDPGAPDTATAEPVIQPQPEPSGRPARRSLPAAGRPANPPPDRDNDGPSPPDPIAIDLDAEMPGDPVDAETVPVTAMGDLLATHPATVPSAPAPVAAPFDARAYSRGVRQRVESRKRYPSRARRDGIQGVATVRVVVEPDGQLAGAPRLVSSSGAAVLDREALRMARAAGRFGAHPGPAAIVIDIPVRFVPGRR